MRDKKSGQVFAAAQQIGKSLFLPIAVLPFAGILLGVGSSFTNETTIAAYGLDRVLHPGTLLYGILTVLADAGNVVFANLALIFALAVALGMTKKEKGVAVLSSAVFYVVMLMTIHSLLVLDGSITDGVISANVKEGAIESILGIQTLQMGVFGGVIAGLITAMLCNRFYKIQFPPVLSFFAGTRFIPIAGMAAAVVTGIILYVVWPVIQNGIFALGSVVQASGYVGTFLYGCIERALIPFGLHHIFYLPFWQTGLGGTAVIDGTTVMGAQNIFFAQLASADTVRFSVDACRFLTGKYPFMMGGLPGAALAMYVTAKPEKRKEAGSLLLSVGLTSFLTGITEPIEFTFLFLAPSLFVVHVVLAGLSFATCHILQICVGTTFSDGLLDLIFYGILPGQAKSNWMTLIPVLAVYFVVYFIVFRFFILKWDLKTPGRETEGEAVHLYSKEEYRQSVAEGKKGKEDRKSALILEGVGGAGNLEDVDCCATRLRLTLKDGGLVKEELLRASGASGVIVKGNGVQIIYGPSVTVVKSNLEEWIERGENREENRDKEEIRGEILVAPLAGRVLPLSEVQDEAFASEALGKGIAIEPSEGSLFAPADGVMETVAFTGHALGMVTPGRAQLLIHVGIDTVKLEGRYFTVHVTEGQQVKKGDLLMSFDRVAIEKEGYLCTTPMIICNTEDYASITVLAEGTIYPGEDLLQTESHARS